MDINKLTVRPAPEPQPYWAVAHVIYDNGPIVAVLWWDDDQNRPAGYLVDPDGVVDEDAVEMDNPGWNYWIVGNSSPAADDPRRSAANVMHLGDAGTPQEALASLTPGLEEAEPPDHEYEESLEVVRASLWNLISDD